MYNIILNITKHNRSSANLGHMQYLLLHGHFFELSDLSYEQCRFKENDLNINVVRVNALNCSQIGQ